ncbi:MAG TPA: hypothetical protein VF190_08885, partial [Rhodothermales bacterium]
VTSILDAEPDHKYEMAKDSIWPLALALVVGGTLTGVIWHAIWFPIGCGLALVVFLGWFWIGNFPEPKKEMEREREPGPKPGHEALEERIA